MLATALPAGCFRRDAGGGFADLSNLHGTNRDETTFRATSPQIHLVSYTHPF